jgi:hypothetical protein
VLQYQKMGKSSVTNCKGYIEFEKGQRKEKSLPTTPQFIERQKLDESPRTGTSKHQEGQAGRPFSKPNTTTSAREDIAYDKKSLVSAIAV